MVVLLITGFNQSVVAVEKTVIAPPNINDLLKTGGKTATIICFGDSVTGLYYHTGGLRTYTDMLGIALKKTYPNAKINMINAGISGNTTVDALSRIEKDVLDKKPDLVTIMFGLNDMVRVSIDDYKLNLIEIISKCRKAGTEVILCTPNSTITTDGRPSEKLDSYCAVVRAVSKEQDVILCDTFQAFDKVKNEDYRTWRLKLSDEIHPNMAGHKLIAEQISKTITQKTVSLNEIDPPFPAIKKTIKLLQEKKPVKILAMKPFDEIIQIALKKIQPEAEIIVEAWDVDGKSIPQLEIEARENVRKMKPDWVILSVPRSASSETDEQYIRSYTWLMNYSLSFAKQEWDCVVVHPSVNNPLENKAEKDDLVRILVRGQDLTLIDRPAGSEEIAKKNAEEILLDWLKKQFRK